VEVNIHDIVNPQGMFKNGQRQREYSTKDLLPLSGRLIPEFDRRRNIKDMFFRKPSSVGKDTPPDLAKDDSQGSVASIPAAEDAISDRNPETPPRLGRERKISQSGASKRATNGNSLVQPPAKRSRSAANTGSSASGKGQQSLMGFFKPKPPQEGKTLDTERDESAESASPSFLNHSPSKTSGVEPSTSKTEQQSISSTASEPPTPTPQDEILIDPIVSKESWSKLFTKKAAPRCEGHEEPCLMMTTKKAGINRGRSFWMCSRPLGPSGQKEKGTQWRCGTFIWASDWNSPN
jgi:AP endonuclease-2